MFDANITHCPYGSVRLFVFEIDSMLLNPVIKVGIKNIKSPSSSLCAFVLNIDSAHLCRPQKQPVERKRPVVAVPVTKPAPVTKSVTKRFLEEQGTIAGQLHEPSHLASLTVPFSLRKGELLDALTIFRTLDRQPRRLRRRLHDRHVDLGRDRPALIEADL